VLLNRLCEIPGIGNWTAQYVAMRALGEPDAFPSSDLGLLRAMALGTSRDLELRAEAWRPWRAYAAMYLWRIAPNVCRAKENWFLGRIKRRPLNAPVRTIASQWLCNGQFGSNFLITPLPAFPRHSCSNPFFQPFKLSLYVYRQGLGAAPSSDVRC
jgi:hypothetical protein